MGRNETLAQKQQTRRQLGEEARKAAFEGNWEDAVTLNLQIIDRFQKDADAFNRLGRAYISLGNLDEAKEAYSKALRADPANLIARRNLQRLEILRGQGGRASADVSRPGPMPRTTAFLEEVGKTWVDELVNPGDLPLLADISAGEELRLSAEEDRLVVRRANGDRVGEVEPKTGRRVMDLMVSGNRYEIFALGLTGQTLRIIIREIYRDPSVSTTVSFPRQITSRAYLRDRDLLRQRDEADFFLFDEDEEEEDAEPLTLERDEEDPAESEREVETFEEAVQVVDEEDSPI
ncbi:MAG: Tetratricopeptide 2 repeat protein [Thermomicrobiales bacterium]|nr:Tetratricopeptide 2 repeat protein [Thermomicrobiales bacterium]